MLIVHELRIGNYIHSKNGVDTVFGLEGEYVMVNNTRRWEKKYVKPITLTEEWLLKFRFYKKDNTYFCDSNTFISIELRVDNVMWITVDNPHDGESSVIITIKYVHQLQNILFCLTNNELTIK